MSRASFAPADEWRGTTVQVCGLFPFSVGTGTPMVGVPLGRHLFTGATVCADPISWFQMREADQQPLGVRARPARTRQVDDRAPDGARPRRLRRNLPLVLGDLKPDYVDLIGLSTARSSPSAAAAVT